jgi:putative methyltransferase (TIGR04325 family)
MTAREIPEQIFRGIFNDFSSTNADLEPYLSPVWIEKSLTSLRFATDYSIINDSPYLSPNLSSKKYLLNTSIFSLKELSRISVADVGGNLGQEYFWALRHMPYLEGKLEWIVYENKELVNIGREELARHPNLKFVDFLDAKGLSVEILHFGSVIQYFDDWQETIRNYNQLHSPKYIVCSDVMAGANSEIVTTQFYYGKVMPFRFLNENTFIEFMGALGFNLRFAEDYFHEKTQLYFQNLPSEDLRKFKCSRNYIFERKPEK